MRANVTFPCAGLNLAGHLYIPDGDSGRPCAAIVVGPSSSGVKEQASGLYARRLSEQGFVALAFDPAYQGESEGEPRGLEDPTHRTEDFKAAVSYLTTRHDVVDHERIGSLGICGSGGYVLAAAAGDHRIKAVGAVAAADVPRHFRYGGDGTQDPAVFLGMLRAAAAARTAEAAGEGAQTFPLFPSTAEEAFTRGGEYGREGFEYYCTPRGEHPRSAKQLPWISVDRMTFFDAFQGADLIAPRPVLLIVGTRAVTSWMSVDAYQRAQEPKELHWIEGASHVDLYDKDEYVTPAVAKLAEFYKANLAAAADKLAFAG
jgi:fermentation-respiration switch protein FrsA (DUF1100 family)